MQAVKRFNIAAYFLRRVVTFTNSGIHLNRHLSAAVSKLPKCFGQKQINLPKSVIKQVQREYRAAWRLFQPSLNSSCLAPHFRSGQFVRQFKTSTCFFSNDDNDKKKKDDDEEESKTSLLTKALIWTFSSYIVITLLSLIFPSTNRPEVLHYISWNEFIHHVLKKGEVEELLVKPELDLVTIILHNNAIIKGRMVEQKTLHMSIVDAEKFEQKLRQAEANFGISPENGVPVIYDRTRESPFILLASIVAVSILTLMLFRSGPIKKAQSFDMFSHLTRARFTIVDPLTHPEGGVRFKDVAGLKEAKVEISEFVNYLQRPEQYRALGAKVPKGVLLLGPPGCGKTMLAKAVSTEASVPFLVMAGSEFIEMIGGLGAARVRDLFREARKRAPSIVYIDEIDAIGRKRSGGTAGIGMGEEEQTLNQLLVELDGMASTEGVIMLASTNRADVLDKALLRPGRFDRHILIDFPTLQERKEIFEHHLKSINLEHTPERYSTRMAQLTPGFSGADIANVCNEAALHAARSKQSLVNALNLEYAVERVVGGTEKRTQVMSLEEKEVIAVHESGHALVGWLLKHTDALMKVSIVPRTTNVFGFAQYLPSDKKLHSEEELFERMCMALGGRVAESLTFNRISTGAEDDLKRVTKMAYAQIREYGMNPVIGHLSFPSEDGESGMGKRPYSKRLSNIIDQQVRNLVARAYKKTEKILQDNADTLKLLAQKLLEKEVLNYDDIEALIGPPPHGKKHLVEMIDWGLAEEANNRPNTPQANGAE